MAKTATKERERTRLNTPIRYNVIMHNDDVTTMEFVVEVLMCVFFKTQKQAEALMMKIHTEQQAIVGNYTFDIATSKVAKVYSMAKEQGFPLQLSVQPA